MELKTFKNKKEVAENFAQYLIDLISQNDKLHIALSGGSTPKVIFDVISENYKNKIDWSKVYFYWGDERLVPPTDNESNFKMTVDHLLSKISIPEENIFRIKGENDPETEAIRYSKVLANQLPIVDDVPQFDLVILGMGDDGHTASIFPYNIELWDADENCVVAIHPDSGQKRVSITGKIINNAKNVAFLVTGATKAEKVREIINLDKIAELYPASLVAPKSENLIWFLDEDAAEELF
ncbi:6-phosphogluconolactonase [Urechidicola croceus]|uniref:6-phosphogluconolactonase n=1 Tax=Urechidicola croceus TaxID=1850246 RepID=A0A1D8P8K6_9FLAO|nr:6-phosphogluconolactonase [Urechidicola croceus]AOW20905.1 6-phosphogluconolactonase [Urechidicola croceus]